MARPVSIEFVALITSPLNVQVIIRSSHISNATFCSMPFGCWLAKFGTCRSTTIIVAGTLAYAFASEAFIRTFVLGYGPINITSFDVDTLFVESAAEAMIGKIAAIKIRVFML